MIQRIQSLYLLIITALSVTLLFTPAAGWLIDDIIKANLTFTGVLVNGIRNTEISVWALSILTAIIPAVSFISLFLFKKRILQVRLNVFNILLMLGYYALLALTIWTGGAALGNTTDWFLEIAAAIPLINVVLTALAIRAILKDEALVRSLNRIR